MHRNHIWSTLALTAFALLWGATPMWAQGENSNGTSNTCKPTEKLSSQVVQLYYSRNADGFVTILNQIKTTATDASLKDIIIQARGDDAIVLYGASCLRNKVRRLIVLLDLPRPSVNLEMWGIQISSNDPKRLAEALDKVHQKISDSQHLLRLTNKRLEAIVRGIDDNELDSDFEKVLRDNLLYKSALDRYRPLSITDMLLRLVAVSDHRGNATRIAQALQKLCSEPDYTEYVNALKKKGKQPFENFLSTRGMEKTNGKIINGQEENVVWALRKDYKLEEEAYVSQLAVLEFAFNYGRLIAQPDTFSPYYFQSSAERLNARMQPAIDALSLDIEELIVEYTLKQIEEIVSNIGYVDYARVGRTSVAGLSGLPIDVTSNTVSIAEMNKPLRLSDLLTKSEAILDKTKKLIPTTGTEPAPTNAVVTTIPVSTLVSLLAALSEDQTLSREIKSGTVLKLKPTVLRNATSAELEIELNVTSDPGSATGIRPLSRVSESKIKTRVYVNALDLFTISTFSELNTVDGGRSYIPVIGTIWEGLFSGIPVFGDLFSWKNPSKNIYHQNLILTNSLINPTVMGIAILYPRDSNNSESTTPTSQCKGIQEFKELKIVKIGKSKVKSSSFGCDIFDK